MSRAQRRSLESRAQGERVRGSFLIREFLERLHVCLTAGTGRTRFLTIRALREATIRLPASTQKHGKSVTMRVSPAADPTPEC